jgi:hypothetical protein
LQLLLLLLFLFLFLLLLLLLLILLLLLLPPPPPPRPPLSLRLTRGAALQGGAAGKPKGKKKALQARPAPLLLPPRAHTLPSAPGLTHDIYNLLKYFFGFDTRRRRRWRRWTQHPSDRSPISCSSQVRQHAPPEMHCGRNAGGEREQTSC